MRSQPLQEDVVARDRGAEDGEDRVIVTLHGEALEQLADFRPAPPGAGEGDDALATLRVCLTIKTGQEVGKPRQGHTHDRGRWTASRDVSATRMARRGLKNCHGADSDARGEPRHTVDGESSDAGDKSRKRAPWKRPRTATTR